MMKKIQGVLLAFSFLQFFSCEDKPSCALPEDQLVLVLTDIQLAEAAAQSLTGAVKDSMLEVYYNQILSIHGVEREGFELCFEELQQDPQRMSLLYERVIEEINRQSARINEEKN